MRNAWLALALVVATLLACKRTGTLHATNTGGQSTPTAAPDAGGAKHTQLNGDTYSIECWGSSVDCLKDAAVLCTKGFDVLGSSESAGAAPGASPASAPAASSGAEAAPDAGLDASAPSSTSASAAPAADAGTADAAVAGPRVELVVKCKAG